MEASTIHWPRVTINELVEFHVRLMLKECGNVKAAAKALGIHRRTLHRMILKNPALLEHHSAQQGRS